jgi:hypothetical protein
MDVDAIRYQFIQDNLQRAFREGDTARRRELLQAFRSYFEWFATRFQEREKVGIQAQLAALESFNTSSLTNEQ